MKIQMFFLAVLLMPASTLLAVTSERLEQLCIADEASACDSLRQRCLKNNKEACFRSGMIAFKAGERESSLPSFQRACKLGLSEGCEAYTKAKEVVATDQEIANRQAADAQAEQLRRRKRAMNGMVNNLQDLSNAWAK